MRRLGAIACFFDPPWRRPSPRFDSAVQGWLLNEAASRQRVLGRLQEALEPMRAALEMAGDAWENAATRANNLSQLALTLGEVADALADAEQAVRYADRSGDGFLRINSRAALADAQHQAGRPDDVAAAFRAAEAMNDDLQPSYRLLYSLAGWAWCDGHASVSGHHGRRPAATRRSAAARW